jgi:hypothetical protein
MRPLAVIPVLLGLSRGVEAKPREPEVSAQQYIVDDPRNYFEQLCSKAIASGVETASLSECTKRTLNEPHTFHLDSEPSQMENIGKDYAKDSRLDQSSKSLIETQKRTMDETLKGVKERLGEKVVFSSEPVLVFDEYKPRQIIGDANYDGVISGPDEEILGVKAPYKSMEAFLALKHALTPEERAAVVKESCDSEGWCLKVEDTAGIWTSWAKDGHFAGFTGDLQLLDQQALYGLKVTIKQKE